jgi:hypothetical protein
MEKARRLEKCANIAKGWIGNEGKKSYEQTGDQEKANEGTRLYIETATSCETLLLRNE